MANIIGTNGNDTFVGSYDADIIKGLAGNDTLIGGVGNDTLIGGVGNDSLVDSAGDDNFSRPKSFAIALSRIPAPVDFCEKVVLLDTSTSCLTLKWKHK
jgi:hypothetical protein